MPIAELDSAGTVEKRYGPGYIVKNDTTYRVIKDHPGSVRMVVNTQTGQIVQHIDYDAWGNITNLQNPDEFTTFTFAGGLYDRHTVLVRFGARDYDPEVGRWTSKGPILFQGGTSNLYEYVFDDPINRVDRNGLQSIIPFRFEESSHIAVKGIGSNGRFITSGYVKTNNNGSNVAVNVKASATHTPNQRMTSAEYGGSACLIVDGRRTNNKPLIPTPSERGRIYQTGTENIGSTSFEFPYSAQTVTLQLQVAQSYKALGGYANIFPPKHVHKIPIRQ